MKMSPWFASVAVAAHITLLLNAHANAQSSLIDKLGTECTFNCKNQFRALEELSFGENGLFQLERAFKKPIDINRFEGGTESTYAGEVVEVIVATSTKKQGITKLAVRAYHDVEGGGRFVRIPILPNFLQPNGETRRLSDWNIELLHQLCAGQKGEWGGGTFQYALITGCKWPNTDVSFALAFERDLLEEANCTGLGKKYLDPSSVRCPKKVPPTIAFVGHELAEWAERHSANILVMGTMGRPR